MSLSDNIKKFRLANNLTQEQLAVKLGVSAQAVSKWETSETYPDGTLLLPLSKELGVSLDMLFDNDSVYMADISGKIMSLIHKSEEKERFNIARDIGWQIERGLFNCCMEIEKEYDPCEYKTRTRNSYILNDNGFTIVSNGKEPFFSVFPQPEEGFGDFLNYEETLRRIFKALSSKDTMNALLNLYRKTENYVFEAGVLEKESGISSDKINSVLEDLMLLQIVWKQNVTINGEEKILYISNPNHNILALFIMAKQIHNSEGYCLQTHYRNTPFIKEK